MAKLKESQISISIDDFGTGYSSLRYLKHLAVDVLKIDRSFVNQLHLDDNDQAIVDTILAIARKLNLEVIAEGWKTPLSWPHSKNWGVTNSKATCLINRCEPKRLHSVLSATVIAKFKPYPLRQTVYKNR